jgi:hypothetical protein
VVDNRDSADNDAVLSDKLSMENHTVKQGSQKSVTPKAGNSDKQ